MRLNPGTRTTVGKKPESIWLTRKVFERPVSEQAVSRRKRIGGSESTPRARANLDRAGRLERVAIF